jgi:hypothetical protein
MKNASSRTSCDGYRFSNGQLEISGAATAPINRKSAKWANPRWDRWLIRQGAAE